MALDLERLTYEVEDRYPRDHEGGAVFSRWAEKPWGEQDYACPGFAFKYTSNKFLARAEATYELVKKTAEFYEFLDFQLQAAEIFDFSAGPGCAAAGVAKFLMGNGNDEPKMTFLDPVCE